MESKRIPNMINLPKISTFTIPNYIRRIEISKAQRAKYYIWDGSDIKAKGKKLLKKYIDKSPETAERIAINGGRVTPMSLHKDYFIGYFIKNKMIAYIDIEKSIILPTEGNNLTLLKKASPFLVDKNNERVIANSTQAGKPKYAIISGQDMYSGNMNEFTRAKIVNTLKESYYNLFKDKIKEWKALRDFIIFPVYIHFTIYDTIRNKFDRSKMGDGIRWDVGNRAYPYVKTFIDFLVNGYENLPPLLEDDDRLNVNGEGYNFIPIEEDEEPKIVVTLYKYEKKI